MWPSIQFSLFDITVHWNTNNTLYIFCFLLSTTLYVAQLRKYVPIYKTATIALITSIGTLIGARLFHVFFENPKLLQTPELIFGRMDGLTFYGGFASGLMLFWLFHRLWIPPAGRAENWGLLALVTSLSFSILKLGCFANGCCWGRITSVPWAVRFYNRESVMPMLGLPVHPVQLYDAFGGFFIFLILYFLYQKKTHLRGQLFLFFALLYPLLRFITEYFRADRFRGENLLFHLSTSQILSVFIFFIASTILWVTYTERHNK